MPIMDGYKACKEIREFFKVKEKVKFTKNFLSSSNIIEEVEKGAFIPIIAAITGENT